MNDNINKQAEVVFNTVLSVLDDCGMYYEKTEGQTMVHFQYSGADMNYHVFIHVIGEKTLLRFRLILPYAIHEDKLDEVIKSIFLINKQLMFGGFEINMKDQIVYYDLTTNYYDCLISPELIKDGLAKTLSTAEAFDDKLLAVNKGYLKAGDVLNKN